MKSRQRSYFRSIQKETIALNQFMTNGIPASKVLDLLEKLIAIRKHPKFGKESFWMSATENLSGAYAYMHKIETVYAAIWPEAEKRKEEQNLKDPKLGWKGFLEFSKQLTPNLQIEIKDLPVSENIESRTIQIPKCSEQAERFIFKFFHESNSGWKIIKEETNAKHI
ncbi:hypothetical protein [Leptospira santarosai]|uniref:hypothetical protein n=1 Tax=Leptospira santarosai TaxID=28183 RepID=UPI0002BDAC75|nr:hypothetical protein [Leptospira santarosai]EMO69739.1 hypothetical protein LEP1GSC130_3712 [Leptospira santarosai str. 200403458]EMO97931.1 hypothetical protein LEP1GSC120_3134 [Leptospira santarosai str. 200702252]